MPGTPGPRRPGGDSDASDAISQRAADTPPATAISLPVTGKAVGARAYRHHQSTTT